MFVLVCLQYRDLAYHLVNLHDVASARQVQRYLLVVAVYAYACHADSGEVVYLQRLAFGVGDVRRAFLDGQGYGLHLRLYRLVHLHVCNGGGNSEEKH